MKIAHIIRALEIGGAERVTVELAKLFAAERHDVTIVAGWPADADWLRGSLGESGITVEYVQPRKGGWIRSYLAAVAWTWRNRRRLMTFDVVHCHLTYGAFAGTLIRLWHWHRRGRPVVVETYHSVGAPISRFARWVHSMMAARRDALVLMATDSYWNRFASRASSVAITKILNGVRTPDVSTVDAGARGQYRAHLGIPETARFVVGSIGMLRPDRQPHIFIPVIAGLVQEFGDAIHWVYAGDGSERAALERRVSEAGIAANVRFAGAVSDIRLPLAIFDLHFTITVGPVGGVAAIEGALAGVPVVGVQTAADYTSRPDDWIWSSARPAALIAEATRLLRNEGERHALAVTQRQYAQTHHSLEQMASAYRTVYAETVARVSTGHTNMII